jgi:hypothetical protein
MSRHKNYQTSLAYQKPNDKMYTNYNKAILGKHVPTPPSPCRRGKKIRLSRSKSTADSDEYNTSSLDNNYSDNVGVDIMEVSVTASESATSRQSEDVNNVDITERQEAIPWIERPELIVPSESSVASRQEATPSIECPELIVPSESSVASGGISSVSTINTGSVMSGSGLAMVPARAASITSVDHMPSRAMLDSSMGGVSSGKGLTMVPVPPATMTSIDGIPYYHNIFNSMQSNMVEHNYIYPSSTMVNSLESEVAAYKEDKRNMEMRVKELEVRLAHQMEKYDYIKEDLKDVKREGSRGDKQINIGNCVIL